MTIFGIDAGLTAPGFAVVEVVHDNFPGLVKHAECFIPDDLRDDSRCKSEFDVARIDSIVARLVWIVLEFKPDLIVVELPTGGAKSASAIRGMAYSTAMTAAALSACRAMGVRFDVKHITPLENKKSSGVGRRVEDADQSKWDVFVAVNSRWPNQINWPRKKVKRQAHLLDDGRCWAIADALSAVSAVMPKQPRIELRPPGVRLPRQPAPTKAS